jgi:uncharacterized protein (UPF0333 family)
MFRKRRGQSALEYALVIAVAIIALLAVNIYLRRGMMGRLKESSDQIGRQWEPGQFTTSWSSTSAGQTLTTENRAANTGDITQTVAGDERVTKNEYEDFGGSNNIPGQHY